MMAILCDICGKSTEYLPFVCRRCHGNFCSEHRLPENHSCPNLRRGNIFENLGRNSKRSMFQRRHKMHNNYKIQGEGSRRDRQSTIIIAVIVFAILLFILNQNAVVSEPSQEQVAELSYAESWDSLLTDYTKLTMLTDAGVSKADANAYLMKSYDELPNEVVVNLGLQINKEKTPQHQIVASGNKFNDVVNAFWEGVTEITQDIGTKLTEAKEEIAQEISASEKENNMAAFDYVNQLRVENGVSRIPWNDKIYDLAKYKAKDMYDRSYFDHVNPEGRCVGSYAWDYGLSYGSDSYADNLYGGGSAMSAVDAWMTSRGHRYNLLYQGHNQGALACHYGNCVFIGQGGSGWVCDTGEAGHAYWNSVGKQPGER